MSKRSGLTLDDGLMIWKARDAYHMQNVVLAVFYLPQFLLALMAIFSLARGLWSTAVPSRNRTTLGLAGWGLTSKRRSPGR